MTANRSTVLDKGSGKSKPLYLQIRQKLADSILADELRPGQRLPNVSKLVREWNVHPRTIKSALDLLEQDGLIRQDTDVESTESNSQTNQSQNNQVIVKAISQEDKQAGMGFFGDRLNAPSASIAAT